MVSYNPPTLGKVGVRSGVSKKMVFGICCDTKKEALGELRSRIGSDSVKWRWKTDFWNNADINDYEAYKQEMREIREQQKLDRKEIQEKVLFIRDNINKLKDEYMYKFEQSFVCANGNYHNIRSAFNILNEWLKMPERLKEFNE